MASNIHILLLWFQCSAERICCPQGPAAQEPHTAQPLESGASFMAAVTDATAPMPGMEGDPNQGQPVRDTVMSVCSTTAVSPNADPPTDYRVLPSPPPTALSQAHRGPKQNNALRHCE